MKSLRSRVKEAVEDPLKIAAYGKVGKVEFLKILREIDKDRKIS